MNPSEIEGLRPFRQHVYTLFGCRRDALFEALDTVLSAPRIETPVHLSLAPSCQREWGSLYDALNAGTMDLTASNGWSPRMRSSRRRRGMPSTPVFGPAVMRKPVLSGAITTIRTVSATASRSSRVGTPLGSSNCRCAARVGPRHCGSGESFLART